MGVLRERWKNYRPCSRYVHPCDKAVIVEASLREERDDLQLQRGERERWESHNNHMYKVLSALVIFVSSLSPSHQFDVLSSISFKFLCLLLSPFPCVSPWNDRVLIMCTLLLNLGFWCRFIIPPKVSSNSHFLYIVRWDKN